jgi:hypothetical protein
MFIECRHRMPNGCKCHSPALRGKPFCFHHAKLHLRNSTSRMPVSQPAIEDLRGIKSAVDHAITALCSPLTDTRRAGLIIYGLNLAANLQSRLRAECAAKTQSNHRELADDELVG